MKIFEKKHKVIAKKNIRVNIDTVDFSIRGEFSNLGASIVTARRDGEQIVGEYGNRVRMVGKYKAHSIYARSMNSGSRIMFQGAPFAYAYGQNLYTSSDLLRGCGLVIKRAIRKFDIKHTDKQLRQWLDGDIDLTRVDLAVNFQVGSESEGREVLHQVGRQLFETNRSMSRYDSTVYFKPRDGKDYQLVFYAKGPQVRSLKRYQDIPGREKLLEHCQGIVRIELRLLASELRKLGLEKAVAWKEDTAERIFRKYMATKLDFLNVTSGPVTNEELVKLPQKMRPVLALHKLGHDLLPNVYSLRTRQRQTKFFREEGIDIRCPNQAVESITTLKKYLSPKKVINDPPQWMLELKLVPPPSKVK